MKEKRLRLTSLTAKTIVILVLLPLSFALVSCGDDDDDANIPDDATLKTMLRKKWVIEYPVGQDKGLNCYIDLTGSVGKVAYQYTQEDCDALGLDDTAWYEGHQGNIQIKEDDSWGSPGFDIKIGDYDAGIVLKEEIKETSIGSNTSLYTGPDVNIIPLPIIRIIENMSGQWVVSDTYLKEIRNALADKLYSTLKSFAKNSDGDYRYYGDVIGYKLKRIAGKVVTVQTTYDGDMIFEIISADEMKVTDTNRTTRVYKRLKPTVTINNP